MASKRYFFLHLVLFACVLSAMVTSGVSSVQDSSNSNEAPTARAEESAAGALASRTYQASGGVGVPALTRAMGSK